MTAETIINKIKTDAEKKAQDIKKEAEQKAKTIKQDATKKAKQHAQNMIDKGKQHAENRKKIMISQAHQNAKRKEMNAKENLIETCFQQAIDQLGNLDDNTYKNTVKQLMLQGKKQISGECNIKISRDLDEHIAKEIGVSITGKTEATGGIILSSKNGAITIDNTFEGILKREKQDIRVKIGNLLFP
ncbi:MAG: hypothetical protein KGY65_03605 [Candidatus Thermoplasmatota archaeon]|nr:hypothetical protein [Candidatus Thermoplasmatota archaeon]MBS3801815.1 hypothetical protein [Candidatus Thermoplasmatota archaeon]